MSLLRSRRRTLPSPSDSQRGLDEDRARYGMDPDPWGRDEGDAYDQGVLQERVAEQSWGEAADDEDGEA